MNSLTLSREGLGWVDLFPKTPGFSEQAAKTRNRAADAQQHLAESAYACNPRRKFDENIQTILSECGSKNWDGYGAEAISREALLNAIHFYHEKLQSDVPYPELTPEPDGEVALEWYGHGGSSCSISFSEKNYVSFASVIKGSRVRGAAEASDINVRVIKELISKTVQTGHTRRW
ncbi:MAG: hypothetical protein Q7V56_14185 [Gammaproteobacteria bacterium]|nr:hypothetical protein [Gammaproteobacteria bacterium]